MSEFKINFTLPDFLNLINRIPINIYIYIYILYLFIYFVKCHKDISMTES